jgi:hypothetical protein
MKALRRNNHMQIHYARESEHPAQNSQTALLVEVQPQRLDFFPQ